MLRQFYNSKINDSDRPFVELVDVEKMLDMNQMQNGQKPVEMVAMMTCCERTELVPGQIMYCPQSCKCINAHIAEETSPGQYSELA